MRIVASSATSFSSPLGRPCRTYFPLLRSEREGIRLPEIFLRYFRSLLALCLCLTARVSIGSPISKTDSFCVSCVSCGSCFCSFFFSSSPPFSSLPPFFSPSSSRSFFSCWCWCSCSCPCSFSCVSFSGCFFFSSSNSSNRSVSKVGGSNGFLRILCGSANCIASFMSSRVTSFLPSSAAAVLAVLLMTISARCVLTPSLTQVSAVSFSKSSLICTALRICFACTIFSCNALCRASNRSLNSAGSRSKPSTCFTISTRFSASSMLSTLA